VTAMPTRAPDEALPEPRAERVFPDDQAQRARLLPVSRHFPAKMNIPLFDYLVETYTKPGDVLLDCFGGSGTSLLAALKGRSIVILELESHWLDVIRQNAAHLAQAQLWGLSGEIVIRQGDARYDLTALVGVDAIVSSPPYPDDVSRVGDHMPAGYWNTADRGIPRFRQRGGYTAPPAIGTADAVITSPPFHNDIGRPGRAGEPEHYLDQMHVSPTISAQGRGYDAVITSQPYADRYATTDPEQDQADDPTAGQRGRIHKPYSQNGDNIGNLKAYGKVDGIVTSPPYGEALKKGGGVSETNKLHAHFNQHQPDGCANARAQAEGYGQAAGNIGELRGQTYLEAMALVFGQCFAVLKPGGVMCLVVGNVVRGGELVRLDLDTIRLCQAAGFTLRERWYRRKQRLSFWRQLHKVRHPDAPIVDGEWVIVCDKPGEEVT
jgi:DNA modification methylase